jgi:4a-hydroxytetrahydrobiopterin dehydratase
MHDQIAPSQFQQAAGVDDWRVVSEGACAFFRTGSLAQSAQLVAAIGALPGVDDGSVGIDIRRDGVTVRLIVNADGYYGLTQGTIERAREVSAVARGQGLSADPSTIQSVLIIPGALNTADVMPFWQAILGYERRTDSPEEDLVDPRDRGPAFWFERMDEPRGDGGGAIHLGLWVPIEQAEARVAAALAAGGRLVRDDFAPSWWTLADAAGNEADVATVGGRG